ncbi:TonB-dependent receptor [Pseudomonas sp. ABC1]|uniref:TonB-dependent receptor n=1 Tax=Pseudomonas sp. ABC1 TaxID=2748080 RepID=UPI0015C3E97F|nr:TonB-dependent receptor [Pseudomonas sp. ABC1]QLF93972.1 TonB-dependent receptor [Pseudomonas sp. ABC1]
MPTSLPFGPTVFPRSRLRQAIGLALLVGASTPSMALQAEEQEPQARKDPRLPDVIVTAERRETSLQQTPVAVGVLDAAALERKNSRGLQDLAAGAVAGLDAPGTTSSSMGYRSIRGIGSGSMPGHNSSVALYLDDVYIPRVINSGVFGLPDIERIEVLRGPQGTLYGQNSSAGAIKVISATPTDEYRASLSLGAGNHGSREAKAFITGAINPGLLYGSFAYTKRENDGTVRNRTLNKDVNRINTEQARAKLRLTPNDTTDIVLTGDALKDTSDNYALSRANAAGYPLSERVTYEDKQLKAKNVNAGLSLKVATQLNDELEFKSITAWRRFKTDPDVWSYDGIPDRRFGWEFHLDQRQVSQEFQLNGQHGALSYTTGVIGFQERLKVNRPNWTFNAYNGITSDTDVQSLGVYGQAHYQLTERLGATAGLRFNKQKDEYDWTSYASNAALENLGTTGRLDGLTHKTDAWTPRLGLDYRINDNLFTYLSFAKGEKAGGHNVVSGSIAVAGLPIEPEQVTAYEWGLKSTALDGRLQSNLALFYNDFDDYQSGVSSPIVNGQVINGSVVVNAASAVLYGAELEVTARVTDDLKVNFNTTYVESEFKDFLNPTGNANTDYTGNSLPGPRWLAGAGFTWNLPFAIPGSAELYGDVSYRSREVQLTREAEVPSRTLVNLGGTWYLPGDQWSLSLNVRNLLDKTYVTSSTWFAPFNILGETYNDPRTVLFSVKRDFF